MLCLAGPELHAHPGSWEWNRPHLGSVRRPSSEEGQQDARQTEPQMSTLGYEGGKAVKLSREDLET